MSFGKIQGGFLGVGDVHSGRSHELKKPSNYINIPNLDLEAGDMRDALVEGSLNKIQAWEALDIIYKVPKDVEYRNMTLIEQMNKALGSYRNKIKGEAYDPGLLFKKLNDYAKSEDIKLLDILQGKEEIDDEVKSKLSELLYSEEFGLKLDSDEYRVKIGLKSDPDVVVAGNDTASCMPFGSGKNNVYTYNPVVGQMVIQKKVGETWSTIAQSVMTKNKDIHMDISELVSKVQSQEEKAELHTLVDEDILVKTKEIITCDNIEVTPNFKYKEILESLYNDFFSEYAQRFGEAENLDTSRIIIGKGYSDAVFGHEVENTFLPMAPIGYSDNIGDTALEYNLDNTKHFQKVVSVDYREKKELKKDLGRGISGLTYKDTLAVSYIEGKAYADNESLKEYMHNMENGLIAKDIYNAHFNKTNMSLKYEDEKGKTQGYLLSYEGSIDGERIIYIADLAANPESKTAGGRLIKAFVQNYNGEYIQKENYIPIYAEARDKTSYAIILNQLNGNRDNLGIKFELKELENYEQGDDTMHRVMIVPVKE